MRNALHLISFVFLVAASGCVIVGPKSAQDIEAEKAAQARAKVDAIAKRIATLSAKFRQECPRDVIGDMFYVQRETYRTSSLMQDWHTLGRHTSQVMKEYPVEGKELAAADAALDQDVRNCVQLPPNAYTGKDRAELEAKLAAKTEQRSGRKVLRVVIRNESWKRKQETVMEGNSAVYYDHAFLKAWVVVENDETTAHVWNVIARKDFLNDEKVTFDDEGYVTMNVERIAANN